MFHEAALGTGRTKPRPKEVATLRKFLHKNQEQRFTDKGTARLLDTIQLHVKAKEGLEPELKEGLLEDALKMPFTVFSTKQKQRMLKWLGELRGDGAGAAAGGAAEPERVMCSVLELEAGIASLMLECGEVIDGIAVPPGELGDQVAAAFEADGGADVLCTIPPAEADGGVVIVELVE